MGTGSRQTCFFLRCGHHLVPSVLSHVRLFIILWTVARQAPLSMEFSGQEYWSGLPFPSPGDLPDPGIEPATPVSPALQANSLPAEPLGVVICQTNSGHTPYQ